AVRPAIAAACLLATLFLTTSPQAMSAEAVATAAAQPSTTLAAASPTTVTPMAAASPTPAPGDNEIIELDELVVIGTDGRRVEGLVIETDLGEADLAAYGADSVGDLLTMLTADVDGTEEGPVVLVNGAPANGVNS